MQVRYRVGERLIVEGQLVQVALATSNRWGGAAYRLEGVGPAALPPPRRWLTPRLEATKAGVVDEHAIRAMVHAFYARVRADPALGPVFEGRLAGRWEPHLEKMVSFWCSVLLAAGTFRGDPMGTHRGLTEGRPEHFARWLELFERTLDDVYEPAAAREVALRAHSMARGLSTAMFGAPFDAVA